MDVAGAALQGSKYRGIHKTNDGADVALRGQAIDGNTFIAAGLIFPNHIQGETFAGILQNSLRLLCLL